MKTQKPRGILNGKPQVVNQILPLYYPWSWDIYISSQKNHWVPSEIVMADDINQWKSKTALSDDERLVVKRLLGFMCGTESLVANNLLLSFFRWVTNPEMRQWLGRQNMEELIHNHSMVHICDSLGMDQIELYEAYVNVPSVKDKDDFLIEITSDMTREGFNTLTTEGRQELLQNAIAYWLIAEGVFFFNGFATLLCFKKQNKLKGIGEIIEYTQRDEENHVQWGTNFINTYVKEYPEVWTEDFKEKIYNFFRKACSLEGKFGADMLPNGILGLNQDMFVKYAQYLVNKRLTGIKLKPIYDIKENPFSWLFEVAQNNKLKNFFETRVTEYQSGGLIDDL